jgi:molybdate transport system substrate-binding protein
MKYLTSKFEIRLPYFLIVVIALVGLIVSTVKIALAEETIIVSSAASLTNVMEAIGKAFESSNHGVQVVLNFGSSGALYQQMVNGAPTDVFASADQFTMDKAEKGGLILKDTRKNFARNSLVLIASLRSNVSIRDLQSLTQSNVQRIALGNPETVPVGRYSKETLEKNNLWEALQHKLILGDSARQVLLYVSRGEVDAGFVYATDATTAKDSVAVAQTLEGHQPIIYPIAATSISKLPSSAIQFVEFVMSEPGQAILSQYGFLKP